MRPDDNASHRGSLGTSLTNDQMRLLTAIRRISHAADSHSKWVERELGITVPQLVVLAAIERLGEVTTGALAEAASLSQATVTTILDKLEAKALVSRYRSTLDRRIVHSRLSPDAQRLLEAAPPLLSLAFVRRFEALSARRKSAVVSAVEQVAELMDAASEEAIAPAIDALAALIPAAGAEGEADAAKPGHGRALAPKTGTTKSTARTAGQRAVS